MCEELNRAPRRPDYFVGRLGLGITVALYWHPSVSLSGCRRVVSVAATGTTSVGGEK
jgi:hypothetical protein